VKVNYPYRVIYIRFAGTHKQYDEIDVTEITSMVAIGQTRSGRYLKVIYSPDDVGTSIFVVTAFDVPEKQIRAMKKRLRRRNP
jgi:hypothetical protein